MMLLIPSYATICTTSMFTAAAIPLMARRREHLAKGRKAGGVALTRLLIAVPRQIIEDVTILRARQIIEPYVAALAKGRKAGGAALTRLLIAAEAEPPPREGEAMMNQHPRLPPPTLLKGKAKGARGRTNEDAVPRQITEDAVRPNQHLRSKMH